MQEFNKCFQRAFEGLYLKTLLSNLLKLAMAISPPWQALSE